VDTGSSEELGAQGRRMEERRQEESAGNAMAFPGEGTEEEGSVTRRWTMVLEGGPKEFDRGVGTCALRSLLDEVRRKVEIVRGGSG